MGLYHSPSVVTNGLVLCLDAGNIKSYPGSGTAWNDLSGRTHDSTLTNGPTFSSQNLGAIGFDGTNDYGTVGNSLNGDFNFGTVSGNSNDFAMEVVVNHGSTASTQNYLRPHAGALNSAALFRTQNMQVQWAYWNASGVAQMSLTGTTTLNTNQWYHIMATRVAGVHTIYVNGVPDGATTNASAAAVNPVTAMAIARYPFGTPGSEFFNGRIALIRVYKNITFNQAQVLQNFNSIRGRYGI